MSKRNDGHNGDEYEVGYKKPPKATQFGAGKSGNPKGRPKGSKNFKTDFLEELQAVIEINEGGKKQIVTKQRALIKRMIHGGISGDSRTMEMVAKFSLSIEASEAGQDTMLNEHEQKILSDYLAAEANHDKRP